MTDKNNENELVEKTILTYREMQDLASHEDVDIRRHLAMREDLRPEILYFLAEDTDAEVRRRIAVNPTTPRQADLLLANDSDEQVRHDLSAKIAKLAPGISAAEQDKIKALTHEALMLLSRDQATRVRKVLSDILKDVADAPPEVIRQLARDVELVVAGPVLQFSPVLTDEDLIEIITSRHTEGALNAIARRETVSESISEAVIAADEESAIADLLANQSAQIREDTLDMLAERAGHVESWHAPLVRRPQLSSRAASRMAQYLADNLLTVLEERADLPEDVIGEVKAQVKKRLEAAEQQQKDDGPPDPMDEIQALFEAGELNEDKVIDYLDDNAPLHVMTALSVMANIRRAIVKKIVSSQSGKGMMALAWKAGLSADLGESLQFKLAHIPIQSLVKAQDGKFPLDEEELSWHLELFGP